MKKANFFENIQADFPSEVIIDIISKPDLRIERIISTGQSTPEGYWYDQDFDEWVILLTGSATLCFEKEKGITELKPGDYLLIPAHCRHRVESTDKTQPSVWLAIHFQNE